VERVAGASRYDTSAALSVRVAGGGATAVFLASGENFPDALAVAPTAATAGRRSC